MKRLFVMFIIVLLLFYLYLPVCAEGEDGLVVSSANESAQPEEPHNTGAILKIVSFLLLAAAAVAMICVLFPKENVF